MPEPEYLTPALVRKLATELDLKPTKKLGQNFVIDPNTVRRIVRDARIEPTDRVLEIGPGLGSLTLGILATGANLTAVEIDPKLAKRLSQTVDELAPGSKLTVVEEDALQLTSLPNEPNRLVANLPYNVSVPVILHLLQTFPSIQTALVMVQAEVGRRVAARPGSRIYGSPSAKASWYGDWREAGAISRQVFWPVPNVDSVLIAFQKRSQPLGTESERDLTFKLVDAAFGQRRKMVRQALSAELGSDPIGRLEAAGIDPTIRGEQLSILEFLKLARTR